MPDTQSIANAQPTIDVGSYHPKNGTTTWPGCAGEVDVRGQVEAWLAYLVEHFPPTEDFDFDEYSPTNYRCIGGGESGPACDPDGFVIQAAELADNLTHYVPIGTTHDGTTLDPNVGLVVVSLADKELRLVNVDELAALDAKWQE
jgi:hypothetical protein